MSVGKSMSSCNMLYMITLCAYAQQGYALVTEQFMSVLLKWVLKYCITCSTVCHALFIMHYVTCSSICWHMLQSSDSAFCAHMVYTCSVELQLFKSCYHLLNYPCISLHCRTLHHFAHLVPVLFYTSTLHLFKF